MQKNIIDVKRIIKQNNSFCIVRKSVKVS